jgi:hypothetical protein
MFGSNSSAAYLQRRGGVAQPPTYNTAQHNCATLALRQLGIQHITSSSVNTCRALQISSHKSYSPTYTTLAVGFMDGLAAAASIVAIIDVSAKVASLCFQYTKAVKNAKADIERMQRKTTDLTHILEELKQFLNGGPDKTRVSITPRLTESLQQCVWELQRIESKLNPQESSKSLDPRGPRKMMHKLGLRALKWPLSSKELDKTMSALEGYQQTFVLAIQLDQT